MKRYAKNRAVNEPKPVQSIELSEKNKKLRIIALCIFILIAAVSFGYGVLNMTSPETGWNEVTSNVTGSGEFVFLYDFGGGGVSARSARKEISALYDEALSRCRMLFSEDESRSGVTNILTINKEPNVVRQVEEPLYKALVRLAGDSSRVLYLQPIYSRYSNIFYCSNDLELADFDPLLNPDIKREFEQTAKYALDSNSVELQILGDNKVKLFVSEEYKKYAAEAGITDFIGFTRLKNAFMVDYIAEVMAANGYTSGIIASYDGFTVNLDDSGAEYSLNIFDRHENTIRPAAVMHYSGRMSIVSMRNYPVNSLDVLRFYETENGGIRTPYIDFSGVSKSSINNLTCFSSEKSCSETALAAEKVFIAEKFDESKINDLKDSGIFSVYCQNFNVIVNSPNVFLDNFYNLDEVYYSTYGLSY